MYGNSVQRRDVSTDYRYGFTVENVWEKADIIFKTRKADKLQKNSLNKHYLLLQSHLHITEYDEIVHILNKNPYSEKKSQHQ